MNIRHLQIFQCVCETESITKAAKKLYISQPAVSKAIQELEKKTGTPLFDRAAQKIRINAQGKQLYEKISYFLMTYYDIEDYISHMDENSPLRIGSGITIANDQLPSFIQEFQKSHSKTPLYVTVDKVSTLSEMLLSGDLDIALLEGAVNHKLFSVIPFGSYRLIPVCAPGNALATKKHITLDELLSQALLLREKGSAVRDTVDSVFLLHGKKIEPSWVSVNSQALIHGVKQNLGISFLPEILVHSGINKGSLLVLPLDESFEMSNMLSIVHLKNQKLSGSMKDFVHTIQNMT